MAAFIEVKYFNSYWLKKIKSMQSVKAKITKNTDALKFVFVTGLDYFVYEQSGATYDIDFIGPGQQLTFTYLSVDYTYTIQGVVLNTTGPDTYKIYVNSLILVDFHYRTNTWSCICYFKF
jgi:hypothetical protein